jgi:hypothetical protein
MVRDTSPVSLHGPWAPRLNDACTGCRAGCVPTSDTPSDSPTLPRKETLTPKSGGTIASFPAVVYRESWSMPEQFTDCDIGLSG